MSPTRAPWRSAAVKVGRAVGVERALLWRSRRALERSGGLVPTGTTTLVVDPADRRAQRLARKGGALDRPAVAAWQRLALEVKPTLVIDVGANYGEVAFSVEYDSDVHVVLVEANPTVASFLRQTVQAYSGKAAIDLFEVAAADVDGVGSLTLGADSGLSSIRSSGPNRVTVPLRRLDSLVRRNPNDRILFKVDVEGAEMAVLRGMSELVDRGATGLCEIVHGDAELVEFLGDHFDICLLELESGMECPVSAHDLAGMIFRHRNGGPWRHSKDVVIRR